MDMGGMKRINSLKVLEGIQRVVRRHENACALIALALAALVLHHSALNAFWRFDDGAHLLFAATYAPWQYFLQPSVTILQSYANVAPYNAFFYDVNLALFGMAPRWHYAHQIALLGAVAFATYRLIRVWQEPLIALLAAALFLTGLPTLYVAQQLMTGHYATGLLFTVLSLHCYTLGVRDGNLRLNLLGAALYLLATSCKEVFVPLVLLLPFLPVGSLKVRVRAALPYVAVAAVYTAWRYAILGRLMGGYVAVDISPVEQFRQLLTIPVLLAGWTKGDDVVLFFGMRSGLNLAAFAVVMSLGFMAAYRRRLSWMLIFAALALLVLPLVPLTRFPGLNTADRYLFLLWWACAVLLAIFVSSFKKHGFEAPFRFACFAVLTGLTWLAQRAEHERISPQLAMQDRLYQAVLHVDDNTALLLPPDRSYYNTVLAGARQTARQLVDGSLKPAKLIVDSTSLCAFAKAGNTVLIYEETCNCMRDVTQNMDESLAKLNSFADHAVPGKPLGVALSLDHQLLSWKFGPYEDGSYSVLLDGTPTKVPASGSVSYASKLPLRFRIRHDAKDGTIAISPGLEFDGAIHPSFAWNGVSEAIRPSCETGLN